MSASQIKAEIERMNWHNSLTSNQSIFETWRDDPAHNHMPPTLLCSPTWTLDELAAAMAAAWQA